MENTNCPYTREKLMKLVKLSNFGKKQTLTVHTRRSNLSCNTGDERITGRLMCSISTPTALSSSDEAAMLALMPPGPKVVSNDEPCRCVERDEISAFDRLKINGSVLQIRFTMP